MKRNTPMNPRTSSSDRSLLADPALSVGEERALSVAEGPRRVETERCSYAPLRYGIVIRRSLDCARDDKGYWGWTRLLKFGTAAHAERMFPEMKGFPPGYLSPASGMTIHIPAASAPDYSGHSRQ
mgnify:CR=1 FL=1